MKKQRKHKRKKRQQQRRLAKSGAWLEGKKRISLEGIFNDGNITDADIAKVKYRTERDTMQDTKGKPK